MTAGVRSGAASASGPRGAPIPARDFLEELERQRAESEDVPRVGPVPVPVPPERTVGGSPPATPTTYDADDLEIPSFLRRR